MKLCFYLHFRLGGNLKPSEYPEYHGTTVLRCLETAHSRKDMANAALQRLTIIACVARSFLGSGAG
jgi:hypothetical protein